MNSEVIKYHNKKIGMHLMCICLSYYMFAILSTLFFREILDLQIMGVNFQVTFALFTYIFLFPIGYIVLKIYGYRVISKLIISTLIMLFVFVLFCNLAINLPVTDTSGVMMENLQNIFQSSLKFYFFGSVIAVPAGAYTSLFAVRFLTGYISNNYALYIVSTLIGEFINTLIVFLLDFDHQYSVHYILFDVVLTAYGFKVVASIILSPLAVYGVKSLENKAKKGII